MKFDTGWELPSPERNALLSLYPPAYSTVLARKILHTQDVSDESDPPEACVGVVVGLVDDQEGIQALVVSIAGETKRLDGKMFHIPWSIDRDRNCMMSDIPAVIDYYGFEPLSGLLIGLIPMVFGGEF